MRRDGAGRADGRDVAREREGLDSVLAQTLDGKRPDALGQRLALGADQEAMMAEGGRCCCQRFEQLDLRRGIDDVVLAANDMGNAEVDVVDNARQRVEIAAVLAHQHGI